MRNYQSAVFPPLFLSMFVLAGLYILSPRQLSANPLIYDTKPWDEDSDISIMEAVGGAGSNTTGEKSSSDVSLQSVESGESIESEESIHMGGDYSKMSSAAANSTSLVRQNFNYFFTSPMAVAHSAVAMTGGIIHQGLVKAQEASQREVHGALEQEQAYLTSLATAPDGERLIAAYRNCKQRILDDGVVVTNLGTSATNLQAIKHCVGGYDEIPSTPSIANPSALGQASAATQVQQSDQENLPDPIYVERAVRASGGSSQQKQYAEDVCEGATYNLQPECFQRGLWDYVYHFVKKRPMSVPPLPERNPDKWLWSDEKAFYFGTVKYTEYKRGRQDYVTVLTAEQQNRIVKGKQAIPPATRWVNFWGHNDDGDSFNLSSNIIPQGYEKGVWSPLSGIELLRAVMFQDVYGGIYALSIKMCEHANAEIQLLEDREYNGFNPRCELWKAPLDAKWSIGDVTVPGLNVVARGCDVSGTPSGRIFLDPSTTDSVDYEFLWPSKSGLSAASQFTDSDIVNWTPRRYYENWEDTSDLPTIKTLLQHLELTEREAFMLRDILLYEIPKSVQTGEYQCSEILNGISYAQIMEFSENKTALPSDPWYVNTHTQYKEPKSSVWPIRSKVNVSAGAEKEISKRISLFYYYANLLGNERALRVVEKSLGSLNNQVSSARYFPEQMHDADRLIRAELPGESIGASMTQRTLIRDELITVKEMLRELHGELKTAARFTDKAGSRSNMAAGSGGAR